MPVTVCPAPRPCGRCPGCVGGVQVPRGGTRGRAMPGRLTVGESGVFLACFLFHDLTRGMKEGQLLTIRLRASAVEPDALLEDQH